MVLVNILVSIPYKAGIYEIKHIHNSKVITNNFFFANCRFVSDLIGSGKPHVYLRHPRLSVNWYPWLTLDRYLIDTSADTCLTSEQHLDRQSVKSQLIFANMLSRVDQYISVGQHLTDYRLTVNGVMIRCDWDVDWVLSKCRPSIDRDVHRVSIKMLIEVQLRVSIDTRQWMPLVHVIW